MYNKYPKRLSYSEIYNFLKYNGFEETLKLYNFKKVDTIHDVMYKETKHKFESISDDCICVLSIIGSVENILDERDDDYMSRLFGRSSDPQFVPHTFTFSLKSFVTKKERQEHNEGNFIRYNRPNNYEVCINLNADEIIYNSCGDYKEFIRVLKSHVTNLYKELEERFPKSEHYYRNDDKIVVDFNIGDFKYG